ncbi:hypothetical protein J1N51_14040 [Psychrosphaera ytuae]|uniref:Uncharacterized protein n=1 Tax=Psychrosphaera ytuae TaxID=2820710 RepID=A0A975HI29_9GAMM|nr:hypothetical protein [Psychrosphaera ytuae]QTH63811.1 hypothetical protein J1N51_14040 [Psychrosphaera ytuae]
MKESFAEIMASINEINDGLRALTDHEILEHQPVIELIKERQRLLEFLVVDATQSPTAEKQQQLTSLNSEIKEIDTLYQTKFENIKRSIKKLQTAQKGVKAYGNVKHSK